MCTWSNDEMSTTLPANAIQEKIAAQPPLNQRGGLFERSPGLVAVTSFEGRILSANRSWTELLGHPIDLMVGRPLTHFVHRDNVAAVAALLKECAESGSSGSLDVPMHCGDGSHKWLSWHVRQDLEQRSLFVLAFDISDRKREEMSALRRASVTALRAEIWAPLASAGCSASSLLKDWAAIIARSLEAVEVGIWTVREGASDPQFAGSAAAKAGGPQAPFELLSDEVGRVCSTAAPSTFVSTGEGAPADMLERIIRDRGIKGILIYPVALQSRVVIALAACFDREVRHEDTFTLEKAAAEMGPALALLERCERLAEAKRGHDALLRAVPVAVCCLDPAGNVTRWNPAAERLFGWSAAELLGRPVPVVQTAARELFQTSFEGALAGQATASLELKAHSRDGGLLDMGMSAWPLADASGAVGGVLIVLSDMTERKRAERRLALQQAVTWALGESAPLERAMSTILSLVGKHLGSSCGECWVVEGQEPAEPADSLGDVTVHDPDRAKRGAQPQALLGVGEFQAGGGKRHDRRQDRRRTR